MRTLVTILLIAASVVAGADADTSNPSRSVEFTYSVTVPDLPESANSAMLWIPLPQTTPYQTVGRLEIDSPWRYALAREPFYGNLYARLNVADPPSGGSREVTVRVRVHRQARSGMATDILGALDAQVDSKFFLQSSSLVVSTPRIMEEAQTVAGGEIGAKARARKLYDHIVDTVNYDKSGEGWGRGDSVYACDVRKGNCTDFHSLFMAEAQSLQIPARFLMGFSLPEDGDEGEIGGYHCWAEFYVEGEGWLPIDASEASKRPERREQFFGGLDEHRIQFTLGRDIALPGSIAGPVNYSIYPYLEVDGVTTGGVESQFSFRNLD